MNYKGEKITVPARVVKVREKGKRLVSFQDTSIEDDVLHITDIREYTELPKFKYTLRVGDEVKYHNGHTTLCEVVTTIAESQFVYTTRPVVLTTAMLDPVKLTFAIVESKHKDAPPKGELMTLNQVNLEIGKIKNAKEIKEKRRRRSAEHVINSKLGGLGREMFTAVHAAKQIDKMMSDPGQHMDVKKHGEDARKMMAKGGLLSCEDDSE